MKKLFNLAAIFLAVVLLCACGQQALPAWADKDTLREKAVAVLDLYHAEQFDELTAAFREDLRGPLTYDLWADSYNQYVAVGGAFLGYAKETQAIGQKSDDGSVSAIAVVTAEYETRSIVYTVSFAEGYVLIGLRIAGVTEKK